MTVPVESLDHVERALVADGAVVLHRDKHVARGAALALLPGVAVFSLAGVAVLAGADPAAPPLLALLPFGAAALFAYTLVAHMVVRTLVTRDTLRIQWGMRRFNVPLAALTRAEVSDIADARWRLVAPQGSVRLSWREGDDERSLLLPARAPAALVAALEAARSERVRVRVASDDGADGALVDEDAAAGLDARRAAR